MIPMDIANDRWLFTSPDSAASMLPSDAIAGTNTFEDHQVDIEEFSYPKSGTANEGDGGQGRGTQSHIHMDRKEEYSWC